MPSTISSVDDVLMRGETGVSLADVLKNLDYLNPKDEEDSEDGEEEFLEDYLSSLQFKNIIAVQDILLDDSAHVNDDESRAGLAILGETMETLDPIAETNDDAQELYDMLCNSHFRALIEAYDDICNCRFEPELVEYTFSDQALDEAIAADKNQAGNGAPPPIMRAPPSGFSTLTSITGPPQPQVVDVVKEGRQPLGITVVRREDGAKGQRDSQFVVERVISGSSVEKQGTLRTGDVILEVNGKEMHDLQAIQHVLQQVPPGKVQLKILPGPPKRRSVMDPENTFYRAFFSYNPSQDSLQPSGGAGLAFEVGDILEVVNREDPNWWQARRLDSPSGKAGLIPSLTLEERRQSFKHAPQDRAENSTLGCASVVRRFSKKKGNKKLFSATDAHSDFRGMMDRADILIYEEVVQVPPSRLPCLVLIGAKGLDIGSLARRLAQTSRKFMCPVVECSVQAPNTVLTSRDQLESAVRVGQCLEWWHLEQETGEGALCALRYEAISSVIKKGMTAVFHCKPSSIRLLRRPEFNPMIVFIAAPDLNVLRALEEERVVSSGKGTEMRYAEDLRAVCEESARLESLYRSLASAVLVQDHPGAMAQRLASLVRRWERDAGWVPATWALDYQPLPILEVEEEEKRKPSRPSVPAPQNGAMVSRSKDVVALRDEDVVAPRDEDVVMAPAAEAERGIDSSEEEESSEEESEDEEPVNLSEQAV